MKRLLICAAATALATGCTPRAEPPVGPAAAMVDPTNPLFAPGYMAMAASSDQFEIQSSQLAMQMSQNPAVRSMAQMLITDHTRMTQQMMATAQSAGMTPPPPTLLPEDQALLEQLRAAPMGTFDEAFRQAQITAHQKALALHQNYASGGDLPAFRTLASAAVPVVQGHLNHGQMLNVAPPTVPPPPPSAAPQAGERG